MSHPLSDPELPREARAKKPSRNRDRLLAAARHLFVTRGYAATGTVELAREAGISRGALYYQFADKKDLFRALVVRLLEEVAEDVTRETMSRIARDRDDLVVGSEVILEVYCRPEVKQVLLLDAPVVLGFEAWQTLQEPVLLFFANHSLQHLVDEGTVAAKDLEPLSQLISGALIRAALAIGQAADPVAVAGRYRSGLLALYRGIIPDAG